MRQSDVGPFKRGLLLGDFLKTSLGPPFALFKNLRVLVDLSKIAITWLFGLFEAAFLLQKLLHRLHFKCMLIRR